MTGSSFATLLRVLALIAVIVMPSTSSADAAADAAFQRQFGDRFFDRLWQLSPDWAIANGYYKYADRLIVPDERARTAYLEQIERWLARAAPHRRDEAEPDRARRLGDSRQPARGEPLVDHGAAKLAVEPVVSTTSRNRSRCCTNLEYAPLDERLRTFLERLENVPAYYARGEGEHREPRRASTRSSRSSRTAARSRCSARSSSRRSRARSLTARRAHGVHAAPRRRARGDRGLRALARGARRARSRAAKRPRARSASAASSTRGNSRSTSSPATRPKRSTSARVAEKESLLTRMALLADLLWPKYFPKHGAAGRPLRQDRPRHREAVGEARRARGARRRGRAADRRSSSAGCASTTCSTLDPTKPLMVRETPPHKRGIARRQHRCARALRSGRADVLQRDAARRSVGRARRELAARVQPTGCCRS